MSTLTDIVDRRLTGYSVVNVGPSPGCYQCSLECPCIDDDCNCGREEERLDAAFECTHESTCGGCELSPGYACPAVTFADCNVWRTAAADASGCACNGPDGCKCDASGTDSDAYQCAADGVTFSRESCESCGSTVAGHRHYAHALRDDSTDEWDHLEVCGDCAALHANGDEPETTDD